MIFFITIVLVNKYIMEVTNESSLLLELTKGKVCMYDIFQTCDKPNCNKEHIQDTKFRNFIKTITRNIFDSSVVKKLPFYANNEKFINNNAQMNEYIKGKGVTEKSDIKYEISDKLKRDILKISNQLGKFGDNPSIHGDTKKTCLSVCSRHLFMPFCNNYKSGNFITIEVRYPDGNVAKIDLCYSDKHYLSFCNCNVDMIKSKKTGRYYIKDIFKINKSIKNSLFNYFKGNGQNHGSYQKEQRKHIPDKNFEMEEKSFPTMNGSTVDVIKPTVWVKKDEKKDEKKAFSPVTFLTLDNSPQKKGPQREISTSSLSEMSSPVQFEIKDFDKLVTEDLTKIKSRNEFIRIIQCLHSEYDKARDLAISYYEKHQRNVIINDANELGYTKIINDLKDQIKIQYREQLSCLEQHQEQISFLDDSFSSDKSESILSDNSSIDDDYLE